MQNPQRYASEPAEVFERAAPAQGHGCGHTVGVSAGEVERAVSAEAHANNINTRGVYVVARLHPVEHARNLVGTPCSAGVLRGNHHARIVAAFGYGVQQAVAAHPLHVVAA